MQHSVAHWCLQEDKVEILSPSHKRRLVFYWVLTFVVCVVTQILVFPMPNALWRMFYFLYINPGLCKACLTGEDHDAYVFKTNLVSRVRDIHERKGLNILCLMHSASLPRGSPTDWPGNLTLVGSQKWETPCGFCPSISEARITRKLTLDSLDSM